MPLFSLDVAQMPPVNVEAAVGLAIAVGALYCFLGYRTLRFVIALTGFILAGAFSGGIAAWASGGALAWMAVAGVAGGVCGAFAMSFLYKVGIFALGLLGGALIASCLFGDREDPFLTSAVIGAAFFGALSGLLLERPVVTVATAAIGAWMTVNGLYFLLIDADAPGTAFKTIPAEQFVFFAWVALAIVGALAQFASYRAVSRKRA